MFSTTQLANGVSLHIRQTTQFKTVNLSIKWRAPLTEEAAANRTVLSNVLQHSNERFPTSASYRSFLDDLFGTILYFDTSKRGAEHTLLMNIETVNDQYLADSDVLNEVLNLIHTAIFKPNLQNGLFVSSIVEREKEVIKQRIESIFDDKSRFAQQRLLKILRPNSPASMSANGTKETISAVTPASLMEAYTSMLENDQIDIYIVGDVNVEEMTAKLKSVLPFEGRTPAPLENTAHAETKAPAYIKEQQDMKQGKLNIGYSTPVLFGSKDFPKMQIFNGIFGGYAHSKIFMNVRERESLAYNAGSSYASHYGLVFVSAGIEPANEKKAIDVIAEQLTAVQNGEISDLELAQTKAMLTNQLKEALDSARGQIEIYDQYKNLNEQFTIDTWAKRWQQVSKEDVQEMAKQVELEAIYFLCGKEEATNENN